MSKYSYIIFDLDGTLISSNNNLKNIIYQYFKEKQPEYYDKVKYSLDFNKISNIQELLIEVYGKNHCETKHTEIYNFLDSHNNQNNFFEGTVEKIIEFKNKYKLFLSTGSSTKFAKQILKKGGIEQYFEKILGSDIIPKSEEHLDIFKDYCGDKNFFKKAISIGDSPRDELFAKNRGIDFIKIGNRGNKDKNIIKSIVEIDKFLQ